MLKGLGRNVWVLGLVSLFTDVSSEMLYPVVPLYLTGVLAAPMAVVGLIEGIAESAASLLKVVSGRLSDRTGRRRPFVVGGYSLSAASKPLLALATTWPAVLGARLLDRVGKGTRGPARDALLAASADRRSWGTAFGLHRALDTAGAVVGPLLAMALLGAGLAYRSIFALAAIPAALAVLCLAGLRATGARRRTGPSTAGRDRAASSAASATAADDPALRRLYAVVAIFALGNSSDVFLLLKARELGFGDTGVLGLYVFYNVVYALVATPAGWLSDRRGRRRVLAAGYAVFALVYAGFAAGLAGGWIWTLFAVYGVYAAVTEGVARAYVADLSSAARRGTAMGTLQMINGVLTLAASLAAGLLWTYVGAAWPFVLGAAAGAAATLLLSLGMPRSYDASPSQATM